MFSYYGSKGKVVDLYPPPKFNKIIEPFAGSARYSLKYFENDIDLYDKSELVCRVWNYLINASEKDILSLPSTKYGDNLLDFNLTEEERFIIYCSSTGGGAGTGVGYKITAKNTDGFNTWKKDKINIAANLYKIKHFKVYNADFETINNETATWFVDPPYQFGGHKYKFSNKLIDYSKLKSYCENRKGQVIVCENTKADWMDFKPMKEMQGIKFKTTEAIWSNYPTSYDCIQTSFLF